MKVKCHFFTEGDEFPHELLKAPILHSEFYRGLGGPALMVWTAEHEEYTDDHAPH